MIMLTSPVNSPNKGQWRGALMFSLICTRINGWVNNYEAGDLRRNRVHYDVIVMKLMNIHFIWCWKLDNQWQIYFLIHPVSCLRLHDILSYTNHKASVPDAYTDSNLISIQWLSCISTFYDLYFAALYGIIQEFWARSRYQMQGQTIISQITVGCNDLSMRSIPTSSKYSSIVWLNMDDQNFVSSAVSIH